MLVYKSYPNIKYQEQILVYKSIRVHSPKLNIVSILYDLYKKKKKKKIMHWPSLIVRSMSQYLIMC